MAQPNFSIDETNVERYIRVLEERNLISDDQEDSDYFDKLSSELDGLWWSFTPEERKEIEIYANGI